MKNVNPPWDIRREGHAFAKGFAVDRFDLTPEKFEMCDGKLFWSDEQRLTTLALLLENIGIDAIIPLVDLATWREAIDAYAKSNSSPPPSGDTL